MIYKKEKASYCSNKVKDCFEYLRQFIGRKLRVRKKGEDFCVCTKYGISTLLTSNRNVAKAIHLKHKDCTARLKDHYRHNISCVCYGSAPIRNIAIECEDCCTVLYDIDNPTK